MSKKLQEKQRKRLAEEARKAQQQRAHRRSNLITLGIALLVAAIVVILIVQQTGGDSGGSSSAPAGVPMDEAGCTDIEEFEAEGREHIDPAQAVEYETTPPTSGNHFGTPLDAGFFPSEQPEGAVLHNLEHGQIAIWYSPDMPEEAIDGLEAYVETANNDPDLPGTAPRPVLAVPYDGLEGDATYAATGWAASQACAEYSRDALDGFRERFQGNGPEAVGVPPFEG